MAQLLELGEQGTIRSDEPANGRHVPYAYLTRRWKCHDESLLDGTVRH